MTLKIRILLLIFLSIVALFALNYYSDDALEEANSTYIADSSVATYQNSWLALMDQSPMIFLFWGGGRWRAWHKMMQGTAGVKGLAARGVPLLPPKK